MSDKISITLEGQLAIEYMSMASKISALENTVAKADEYIKTLTSTNEVPTPDVPEKVLQDSKLAADLAKPTSKFAKAVNKAFEPIAEETPFKLKTRLSKQDKIDLDELAEGKFRSKCRVDRFAGERMLRESTVLTYIKKHSGDMYYTVHGRYIAKHAIWDNAIIDPDALYFTKK